MEKLNNKIAQLPPKWSLTKLGEICTSPQYGYTTKAVNKGNIKLIRTTDITSGKINWGSVPYCQNNPEEPEKYLLKDEDIVISRAGSVGVSYLIKNPEYSVFASYLIRFTPLINKKFFKFFLNSPFYWDNISEKKLGIAIPNVNANKLKDINFPLPPLPEQHRIVVKIEELFSDLDNGIEQLKTAQQQLKVYRQAVLKWAFEGKLTEKWRKTHHVEPAERLLEQIKTERENRYQQQLEDWEKAIREWEANDKQGKKPAKPQKPKELSPLSGKELAELLYLSKLPEKWCWVKLGNITNASGGITKNPKRKNLPFKYPFLRVANVYSNFLELNEIHEIGLNKEELERVLLKKDDLLIVEGNGSIDQIGRVAIWNGMIDPCVHQNHIIKARANVKMEVKFYLFFLLSISGRNLIKEAASSTSGLYTLSLSKVESLKVPLLSKEEQHQIVQEIETRLSVCDNIETNIKEALQKSEALRQNILKKAFEGKLVPQDQNDEPASVLLERIKTEKIKQETEKKNPNYRKKEKAL